MFDCGIHNFKTSSYNEWKNHLETIDHETNVQGECIYCGNRTKTIYVGKIIDGCVPILCDSCKQKIEEFKKILDKTFRG